METQSGECCFICIQFKYESIWVKSLLVWQTAMLEK